MVVLVCLVALLSYLAPRLAGALLLHPQTLWPLWPGCALLVSVLLLVRRTIWPMVVPAALVAFALYDVQAGVPSGSIAWFIAANTVQVVITALCLGYFFDGMPRLNSIRALSTYAFFAVLLAPSAAALLSALGIHGDYWRSWSIAFFSEALAFVTLLPAILTWVSNEPEWARKSRAYQVEFAVLITGLGLLGYVTFTASESSASPLLLSSVVPFLLWAALRFGSRGTSSAVIVVTFLSIWAAVHGRGPFVERGPLSSMLSLQLFLILAATSFMVLAALVEERKRTEDELREIEARFHLAAQAGRMYAYEWDATTDMVTRSEGCLNILGLSSSEAQLTRQQFSAKVHPDDRALFVSADRDVTPENRTSKISYRVIRSDGSVVWVERNACAFFDEQGRLQRMVGMVADITERQRAEETLLEVNRTLEAQAALLQSSEDLLKIFVKNVPVGVAMFDRDMRYLEVSDRWCADYSFDSSQVLGRSHYELFPDIPPRWKEMHRRGLDGETLRADEDRWDREGGTAWLRWEIRPWRTPNGIVGGILIFAEQITHRKQMEEAISSMSKKLIESQEQERARIGRELHDDINQRLGLLAVQLEQLRADPSEVQSHVQELLKQATEISDDVQALSHQLDASKLEYLGALGGMRSWCKEFGERQGMQIDFQSSEANISVPREIGLCLFRVLQEALHNAAKYSGVRRIEVQLREDCGDIHLLVTDLGRGFDLETARQGRGLGLTSMQERVRLVNGILEIRSTPMGGTTVHVCVPLTSEPRSQAAAG